MFPLIHLLIFSYIVYEHDFSLLIYLFNAFPLDTEIIFDHPRAQQRYAGAGIALWLLLPAFAWLTALLAVVGVWFSTNYIRWMQLLALLWVIVGVTYVLGLFRPYLVNSELSLSNMRSLGVQASYALALLLGFTLAKLFTKIKPPFQWGIGVILVLSVLVFNFAKVDRSQDDLARAHTKLIYELLPDEAVVFTDTRGYSNGLQLYSFLKPNMNKIFNFVYWQEYQMHAGQDFSRTLNDEFTQTSVSCTHAHGC